MSEVKTKVVEDLPGVGPAIAEKLREAGYDTLEAIGTQAPGTPVSYQHLTLPTKP